jgi:hypothetical protein
LEKPTRAQFLEPVLVHDVPQSLSRGRWGFFLVSSGNIPMLKGKTATGGPGVRKVAKKRRKKIKVIF